VKIDDRGRIGGKISLIDVAIAAIVIIAAVGLVIKIKGWGAGSGDVKIVYEVRVRDIRRSVAEMLLEGDEVWVQGGGSVGIVVGQPVITDAMQLSADMYGNWGDGEKPIEGKVDLTFRLKADASESSGGRLFVDKTFEVILGRSDIFLAKYVSLWGMIIDFETVSA